MKIILIGFACCYKSSAGKLLAQKLNCKHVDTDKVVELVTGKTVADIFAASGEAEFRKKERDALMSLTDCDNVVISCGGGSVLCDDFKMLAEGSTVVWLTATADTVASRLGNTPRPLFDGKSVCDIDKLIKARNPYYLKYAEITIATGGLTSEQVAESVYNIVRSNGKNT